MFQCIFTFFYIIIAINLEHRLEKSDSLTAVPFKSGGRNGRLFEGGGGEGPNSELLYPIILHMISGRRGGVSNF